MKKVFFGTLISKAHVHLREVPTHLLRAQSYFFIEKSIDSAVSELKDAIKLLEKAKEVYVSSYASVNLTSSSHSLSSRSKTSSSLS